MKHAGWMALASAVACAQPGDKAGADTASETDGADGTDGTDGADGAEETDADGDGWSAEDDCDDTDPAIHPEAAEVCDGVDNDCDGDLDDADDSLVDGELYYSDGDRDGFGADGAGTLACAQPPDTADRDGDCDDSDDGIHPDAEEICGDGIDQDCSPDSVSCVVDAATRRGVGSGGTRLGAAVETRLELGGSGATDLAVGIPLAQRVRGAVELYTASGVSSAPTYMGSILGGVEGGATASALHSWDDSAGDYSVLAVHSSLEDELLPGTLHGFIGPVAGDLALGADSDWNHKGARNGDHFGGALVRAQSDTDGAADLWVGASDEDNGGPGSVYVIQGPGAGAPTRVDEYAVAIFEGPDAQALFGRALATADFNSDGDGAGGLGEVAMGAPGPGAGKGAVYLHCGLSIPSETTGGAVTSPAVGDGAEVASDAAYYGSALAAGDLDGDGHADLVVGAPLEGGHTLGSATIYDGAVYIYPGDGACGFDTSAVTIWRGPEGGQAGWDVELLDADGDGARDELAVSAPRTDLDLSDLRVDDHGAVALLLEPASGGTGRLDELTAGDGRLMVYHVANSHFGGGGDAMGAVDLTGDDADDLVVGAPVTDVNNGALHLLLSPGE